MYLYFMIQQGYCVLTTEETRLFPVEMLRSRDMISLFIQSAASNACIFIPISFISLYFQFVRNDDVLESAVRLFPYIVIFVLTTVLKGALMSKTRYCLP